MYINSQSVAEQSWFFHLKHSEALAQCKHTTTIAVTAVALTALIAGISLVIAQNGTLPGPVGFIARLIDPTTLYGGIAASISLLAITTVFAIANSQAKTFSKQEIDEMEIFKEEDLSGIPENHYFAYSNPVDKGNYRNVFIVATSQEKLVFKTYEDALAKVLQLIRSGYKETIPLQDSPHATPPSVVSRRLMQRRAIPSPFSTGASSAQSPSRWVRPGARNAPATPFGSSPAFCYPRNAKAHPDKPPTFPHPLSFGSPLVRQKASPAPLRVHSPLRSPTLRSLTSSIVVPSPAGIIHSPATHSNSNFHLTLTGEDVKSLVTDLQIYDSDPNTFYCPRPTEDGYYPLIEVTDGKVTFHYFASPTALFNHACSLMSAELRDAWMVDALLSEPGDYLLLLNQDVIPEERSHFLFTHEVSGQRWEQYGQGETQVRSCIPDPPGRNWRELLPGHFIELCRGVRNAASTQPLTSYFGSAGLKNGDETLFLIYELGEYRFECVAKDNATLTIQTLQAQGYTEANCYDSDSDIEDE